VAYVSGLYHNYLYIFCINRCQFFQDFVSSFGPEEGLRVLIAPFQVSIDSFDQVQNAAKDTASESLLG